MEQPRLWPRTPLLITADVGPQDVIRSVSFWCVAPEGITETMVVHLSGINPEQGELVALGQAVWAGIA